MRTRRNRDDSGASAVEYAILVSAIAAVVAAVVFGVGLLTSGLYSSTSSCYQAGVAATC